MNCQKNFDKVSNTIQKGFDSEPDYNERYLRIKIKSMKQKSSQIFKEIKYQRKIINVFAYQ